MAAIVATGGAATPLVMGAVGAASAVAMQATDEMADEYIKNGNLRHMDWGKTAVDSAVAGGLGFASGYIGAGISEVKPIKYIKGVNKATGNVAAGTASQIVNGARIRTTKSFAERKSAKEIAKDTFNAKEIGKDIVKGTVNGIVNERIDSGVAKTKFLDKGLNSDSKITRGVTSFATEGTKGVTSGVVNRTVNGERVLDPAEMKRDFIKKGVEGAAKNTAGKKITGKEITAKDLKDDKIRSKIPTDVVSNPEKWISNNGKIYMDNNGKVTFEASDEKARNTYFSKPKDKLFYGDDGKPNYERSTVTAGKKDIGGQFKAPN